MASETELKLTLSAQHLNILKNHPIFQSKKMHSLDNVYLKNSYYDTPSQQFSKAKSALRVRSYNNSHIQTFKTQGIYIDGLQQRGEWEWEIPTEQLELDKLAALPEATALIENIQQEPIELQFTTHFERQSWIIKRRFEAGKAKIELALDQGQVETPASGSLPICELELELVAGEPLALFDLAIELARWVPLMMSDMSKAAMGYRLLAAEQWQPKEMALPQPTHESTQEDAYMQLMFAQLITIQRCFEHWNLRQEWQDIESALNAVRDMLAISESFIETLSLDSDSEAFQLLHRLHRQLSELTAWRRLEQLTQQQTTLSERQASQAAARLSVLLQTREPGLMLLLFARDLSQRVWRCRWKTEQQSLPAERPFLS